MKYLVYIIFPIYLFASNISLAQSPFGKAIAFDGNGDYASTINEPYFPTINGTIELWIISFTTNLIGSHFITKNREQWNIGDMYLYFAPSYGSLTAIVQSTEYNPI